jgi:hypothetical protein
MAYFMRLNTAVVEVVSDYFEEENSRHTYKSNGLRNENGAIKKQESFLNSRK